jgi:phage tail sheath gpL-like
MGTLIAGFSPQDKVPGAYGEVVYGVSGQNAASAPLLLLLVGLMITGGSLIQDTQVQQVFGKTDCDTYATAGSELAAMGYDAIDQDSTVPVFIASPAPAGGAVAAGATLACTGSTATGAGTVTVRASGKAVSLPVLIGDTPSAFTTRAVGLINGALTGRFQISATASTGNSIIVWKTPGVRGNQAIVFVDTSQAGSTGLSFTLSGSAWVTATVYPVNSYVVPTVGNGFYYKATAISGTGTSGASQPTWPTTVGTTVIDNSGANQITWTCWGAIDGASSSNTYGVQLGGGTGLETYTNILSTIVTSQYDRIALACNDSTSLAAWKAQLDAQMAAPVNIMQMAVCCVNGTLAAATTLNSGGTLNDQVFQVGWTPNGETHPSRQAAQIGALRAGAESTDPDAPYNWKVMAYAAPLTQKTDWQSHAQLVTALNSGVTPLTSTDFGSLKLVRSITSHCLLSGNADYSTLDTGQASVPQFVFKDLRLYWTSVVAPQNPRVAPDPAASQRNPPQGVMYPSLWSGMVYAKLQGYAAGNLTGGNSGASAAATQQVPPILINVVPPTSNYDFTANRIMTTIPLTPAPNNAQCGISVKQFAPS